MLKACKRWRATDASGLVESSSQGYGRGGPDVMGVGKTVVLQRVYALHRLQAFIVTAISVLGKSQCTKNLRIIRGQAGSLLQIGFGLGKVAGADSDQPQIKEWTGNSVIEFRRSLKFCTSP